MYPNNLGRTAAIQSMLNGFMENLERDVLIAVLNDPRYVIIKTMGYELTDEWKEKVGNYYVSKIR